MIHRLNVKGDIVIRLHTKKLNQALGFRISHKSLEPPEILLLSEKHLLLL